MLTYDNLNYLGAAALLVYNLLRFQQHQSLPYGYLRVWAARRRENGHQNLFYQDGFWVFVGIVLISAVQYGFAPILNSGFGDLVGTGSNYFGLLLATPFLLMVYCRIMGVDMFRQIDIVVPALPLALVFAKLGCCCAGCCRGVPWEFGPINPRTQLREFPSQFLEAVIALCLFLFLLVRQKRFKSGTVYPIYIMLYSGIRFFTEFLRNDPNLIGCFKRYHLICLVAFILGAIGLWIVSKRNSEKIAQHDNRIEV